MNRELLQTYEILEKIGSGSGGVIYKAYHKRLMKTVVLKRIIDPGYSTERNRQEVDILKNINHSYLPQVLDFFDTDEGVFTVMNYIPGKSFQQLLKERARFSREDILKWAMQICSALNYLHTRKIPIIHGDIKPSNIMLKPDGDICLIDFNISFYFNHNTVLGCTRGYSSPEQYQAVSSRRKQQDVRFIIDNKADIYSVGVTLYHLATGELHVDYKRGIDIERLAENIGWPFAKIIAKASELDPAKRYQSADEMYQALKRLSEGDSREQEEERSGRRKVIVTAVIILVLIALGGGVFCGIQKAHVNDYNAYVESARNHIRDGKIEKAREECEEAIRLIEDAPEAYYWRDYTYFEQGEYARCCELLEEDIPGVDRSTEDEQKSIVDLYCLKGTAYMEQGDPGKAIQAFETAEEQFSAEMSAQQYRDYAVALARHGKTNKARQKIDAAKEAEKAGNGVLPKYALSYTEGEILLQDQDRSGALECFRDAADRLKGKAESQDDRYLLYQSYMAMYRIYEQREDHGSCADVMEEALEELSPGWEAQIRRNLGYSYNKLGEFSAAAEQYREVANSDAGRWADWRSATAAYAAAGDGQGGRDLAIEYGDREGEDFCYWFLMAYSEETIQDNKPNGSQNYDDYEYYYSEAMHAAEKTQAGEYSREKEDLNNFHEVIMENRY